MASGTAGGTVPATPPGAGHHAWEKRDAAQDESDELQKREGGDARAIARAVVVTVLSSGLYGFTLTLV